MIIPNRAKSAATIIALGADEIVMGFCSEIGPIDPQIPVVVGGLPHYVSAQSFIDHCEKLMDFSRDVATKYLNKYMFVNIENSRQRNKLIENIITGLSSTTVFKVHGRMIDGHAVKTDLNLNVRLLGKDDALWKDIWHYYIRAGVLLAQSHPLAKLIETKDEFLIKEMVML